MNAELISYLLGCLSALMMGFSKTAVPGASIPAVALMAEAFRGSTALSVGAMLPVLLVGDVLAVLIYGRDAQWKRLIGLFPFVLVGMAPAYLVLWAVEETDGLRPILGGLVLGLFVLEVARRRFGWQGMPRRRVFIAAMGCLAGFCTTVGNAAGPVMSVYLLSAELPKRQFVGTCAWFFFLVNLTKIIPYTTRGMITAETLRFDLAVAPVAIIGALGGIWLLPRISQAFFNRLVLALAGLAGLWLFVV